MPPYPPQGYPAASDIPPAEADPAFPVGSIFIATTDTDPKALLGYGSWNRVADGRLLVGVTYIVVYVWERVS